jgi:hypothetical protein
VVLKITKLRDYKITKLRPVEFCNSNLNSPFISIFVIQKSRI